MLYTYGPSGNTYPDYDSMVLGEGYGWTVVAVRADGSVAACHGMCPTRREARNAAARLKRAYLKRREQDGEEHVLVAWRARPVYREEPQPRPEEKGSSSGEH